MILLLVPDLHKKVKKLPLLNQTKWMGRLATQLITLLDSINRYSILRMHTAQTCSLTTENIFRIRIIQIWLHKSK